MDDGEYMEIEENEEEEEIVELESEDEEEEEEEEDDDFKELEELIPPKVTSWTGADGKTIHGIMVFNDGPKICCQMDVCPICYHAWTSHGKHRICCLPCGHMYGLSCIKKWLLQSSSSEKCPQCNKLCSYKDVILLYASRLCASPQHKQSSTRYFPFTKHGFNEFKHNEKCRWLDAHKLYPYAKKRLLHVCQQLQIADNQHTELMSQWNDVTLLEELKQRAEESGQPVDELGQPDALQRQAEALKRQADELEQHGDALEERVLALKRRFNALGERVSQYLP
ncbi:zinc finger, RING/FYVE/PHD-type containing protein, partial [Tanacetum coccineum]